MAGLEGRTLDRYELRQLLGKGGMADVYLSYDLHFDRDVAVKVFKREDEDLLRRFIREAHLMASLSNSHLIPVYDAGMTVLDNAHVYYIVMPYMEGGTLRARIRRTPLDPSVACRYLRDIADALDYLHQQGIIHRDIKASNVLLDVDDRCYLSDFGIARTESDAQMTSTGNVLGTVDYIAPELFENNRRADAKSDLYSLGVLLFEMVTGELPFTAENQIAVVAMHVSKRPPSPRSLVPSLSPTVERVVYKALEKRPEARYTSAGAMADAFCRAAANLPVAEDQLAEPLWEPPAFVTSGYGTQDVVRSGLTGPLLAHIPVTRSVSAPPLQATGTTRAYAPLPSSSAAYPAYHPLSEPPPPRRSNKNPRSAMIVILALIALLAVLGPAAYVIYNQNANRNSVTPTTVVQQPTPDLTGTAQVNNAATATQQVKASTATAQAKVTATAQASATASQNMNVTATAQAKATATVQAKATATAGVIATATADKPVYSNPLTSAAQSTTWDQHDDRCVFAGDGYHVKTTDSAFQMCGDDPQNGQQYSNFAASVDLMLNGVSSGGIFFRVNPDNDVSGYLFEINGEGMYRISDVTGIGTDAKATVLQDWTEAAAIQQGEATNTLQIFVRGGQLSFYANDQFLLSMQATHYFTGTIGFLATKNGDSDGEAVYHDLNIYSA